MGTSVVLLRQRTAHRRGRGRRRGQAAREELAWLDPAMEPDLEAFLLDPEASRDLPTVNRWDVTGPDIWLSADEMDQLITELDQAAARAAVTPGQWAALLGVRALAERCRAEGLVMAVVPD